MKLLHALKSLLSGNPKPLARSLRWPIGIAAVLGALYLALSSAFESYKTSVCGDEVLANISGVLDLDFEVKTRDCWHGSRETGVFVSKPGRRRKTLLFLYHSLEVPTITSIDGRTIQITLGDIYTVHCRADKWEGLTIKYHIRSIEDPRSVEPRECKPL